MPLPREYMTVGRCHAAIKTRKVSSRGSSTAPTPMLIGHYKRTVVALIRKYRREYIQGLGKNKTRMESTAPNRTKKTQGK
jgi:hypothetical protein